MPPGEQWRLATNRHTRIHSSGYELVRLPNQRTSNQQTPKAKYFWTWRYTPEQMERFEEELRRVVARKSENGYLMLFDRLQKTLGFAGSREQAFDLLQRLEQKWYKTHGMEPPKRLNGKLPTARRMANEGIELDKLCSPK